MERLRHFPIPFFAVIMGVCGLAIVFEKASQVFELPFIIGESLAFLSAILFCIILGIYILKTTIFFDAVKEEFNHPIRINFFATISISLLLLSIALIKVDITVSEVLWYIGTILHTYMTFHVVSFWIRNNFEITHSNPAWFIPIVGNVLIPVAGVEFVSKEIASYFFSIGMFWWIVLGSVLFYRIVFHHQLAAKFMPTLFILIAPPAIGFIAYMKLFGTFDAIAVTLINMTIFFTALTLFMFKNFVGLKFFISWWAFTFPLDASAVALMSAFGYTGFWFYEIAAEIMIIVSSIVVCIVFAKTVIHIAKKEICLPE